MLGIATPRQDTSHADAVKILTQFQPIGVVPLFVGTAGGVQQNSVGRGR
jgi:hypothetical protein